MLAWLAPTHKAVLVLLTKSDKLNRQQADAVRQRTEAELALHPGETAVQIFSGTTKAGVRQAQAVIARHLKK